MSSRLPMSKIIRGAIRHTSEFNTPVLHRSFHPSRSPPQIQESNKSKSIAALRPTPITTPTVCGQAIGITSPANMGRSGYDTTNMKVATKAPRPASSKQQQQQQQQQPKPSKAMEDGDKNRATKQMQQQQQKEHPQAYPIYNIPQLFEHEQQQHGRMPMPNLEGRGWTFWQ